MPRVSLTKKFIDQLDIPENIQVFHDTKVTGLQLRVSSKAGKTFYLYFRTKSGKQKRGSRQAKLQVTGRDIEDLELNLKLDETTMNWQIDKGQDDRQLTALQNDVLQLVPTIPASIRSREIADQLGKEQSQISDILKKLTNRGFIFGPVYSEYSKSPY